MARVEKVERRVAFAIVVDVIEASPDRRDPIHDPLCGGCLYAHISGDRQRAIKGEVIADAFARIGKHTLTVPVDVAASPEHGYRMRARLHVRNGRAGFYREGSHELCDAAGTGQLAAETLSAVARVVESLTRSGVPVSSLEIAENIPADQRAVFVEISGSRRLTPSNLESLDRGVDSVRIGGHTRWKPDLRRRGWHLGFPVDDHRRQRRRGARKDRRVVLPGQSLPAAEAGDEGHRQRSARGRSAGSLCRCRPVCRVAGCFGPGRRDGG